MESRPRVNQLAAALAAVTSLPPGTLENDSVAGRWPDGKARPHKVKTKDGTIVALTDEEFDRLLLEARHKRAANPIGPRKTFDFNMKVGEAVIISRGISTMLPDVSGQVLKKKPGRLEVRLDEREMAEMRSTGTGVDVSVGQADDPYYHGYVARVVTFGRNSVRRALA